LKKLEIFVIYLKGMLSIQKKSIIIGKYANPRCFKNPAFNAYNFCLHQPSIQQNHLESTDEVENILMNFINMNLKQKHIDEFFIKN
jgi:hypothetical protein